MVSEFSMKVEELKTDDDVGKHVVFGQVRESDVQGRWVVRSIEATGSNTGKVQYSTPATIVGCGAQ